MTRKAARKARPLARALGMLTYIGSPCYKCGGTERYVSRRDCVPCQRAKAAERKALLFNAMPSWVDRLELQRIYALCPYGYHVDHRVPLSRGGWHVPWNLRYLPGPANIAKNARLWLEDVQLALIMEAHWLFEDGIYGISEEGDPHSVAAMVEASPLVQAYFLEARAEGSTATGA